MERIITIGSLLVAVITVVASVIFASPGQHQSTISLASLEAIPPLSGDAATEGGGSAAAQWRCIGYDRYVAKESWPLSPQQIAEMKVDLRLKITIDGTFHVECYEYPGHIADGQYWDEKEQKLLVRPCNQVLSVDGKIEVMQILHGCYFASSPEFIK